MPVILSEQHHAAWLGETDNGNLKELLLRKHQTNLSIRLNSNKGTKCDIEIRVADLCRRGSRLQFMSRLAPPRLRLIRFPAR
jgi:hypothetical protein